MRSAERLHPTVAGWAAALALAAALAFAGPAAADAFLEAEAASAAGDCGAAVPLYEQALAAAPAPQRQIAATHALSLCLATPGDVWQARELMANLLPVVIQHSGAQSPGLARHHALWSEIEVRAGAVNVAWRRSEAAIAASRAAGRIDPFEHAAELYRLAAVQYARGVSDSFLAFLTGERARLEAANWSADGDPELFDELIGAPPSPGNTTAFAEWTRAGLEELDPRPIYLDLLGIPGQ